VVVMCSGGIISLAILSIIALRDSNCALMSGPVAGSTVTSDVRDGHGSLLAGNHVICRT